MRNTILFAIAIISMVTASCSVKEEQVITKELKTVNLVFEATNEGEASTKTVVQSDGSSVWWSAHENINIFYGASASSMFTSTNDTPVAKAQFSGSITAFTGETEGNEADYFWGVYPYNALNTCDGSSITATLSGEQTACAGSFADNQWLTLAKSQGLALSFRAVCAGFRFSVTKSGVKSVTFRGNNNEILAGKARIGMDGNNLPTVLANITEVKEITLSAPANETLEVGTMYYMTFYPTNFTNGFTVTFNTETETATRVYSTAKNFARTQVHIGANFDSALEYTLIHPNNEIWYTTQNGTMFTNYALNNWNGLISHTYTEGLGKLVFEDDVLEIPQGVFHYVSGSDFTSLSFPASLQVIRRNAFHGNYKLAEIVIPSGCSCEEGAFSLMSGIQRIVGDNATEDGRLLIENNTIIRFADEGVTNYEIPDGITKIGEGAFAGSMYLTSLTMPSSIEELGNGAFSECVRLTSVVCSNKIETIPSSCFYQAGYYVGGLSSISLPNRLTRIEDWAFTIMTPTNLIIPSLVTYIGNNVKFVNNDDTIISAGVRVLAPTPPTLNTEHAFGRYTTFDGIGIPITEGTHIKVPASSVALYKADPKWSKYYIEADSN